MKILHLIQGSPEWIALRAGARRRCASDAPVMMGASPHVSRSELVRMKATGDEREFSDWVRDNILENGHAVEALARVHIEQEIGEDLYPVTATDDAGLHLASFDGLTMDEETAWEHKQHNEELAAAIRAKDPPPYIYWQLEHQLLVGADCVKRVRLTVSDGTTEKRVEMVYEAIPGRREQLIRAWVLFEEDVANYQHVEVAPKAVAQPTMSLPSVAIEVSGQVALTSNLALFGERLRTFIAEIKLKPETDQDFANAEAAVKTLETAEERLKAAEGAALARVATVDEMRSTVASFVKLARDTRLMLSKLVESEKASRRSEIQQGGVQALQHHVAKLNERLGKPYMPRIDADFAGAMRGKKTIATLQDAVSTELAHAKIAASAIADQIEANLKVLAQHGDHAFLFADAAQITLKANDDFEILVKSRITEHQQKEAARLEQERERIRAEEAAKLKVAASAPAAATAPRVVTPVPAKAPRPTDEEIIWAISERFQVSPGQALAWLLEVDLRSARQHIAA